MMSQSPMSYRHVPPLKMNHHLMMMNRHLKKMSQSPKNYYHAFLLKMMNHHVQKTMYHRPWVMMNHLQRNRAVTMRKKTHLMNYYHHLYRHYLHLPSASKAPPKLKSEYPDLCSLMWRHREVVIVNR
jgi:hypothetical protein